MNNNDELIALSSFNYEHGLNPASSRKAFQRNGIEVFDVLGSRHIRRSDGDRLIELEAQPTDGYEK